jgi:hypothetical protein
MGSSQRLKPACFGGVDRSAEALRHPKSKIKNQKSKSKATSPY